MNTKLLKYTLLCLIITITGCASVSIQRNWVVESHPKGFYYEYEVSKEDFLSKEEAEAHAREMRKRYPDYSISVYAHGIVFVPR